MNLLEHYIIEIESEEKLTKDGKDYYKVQALVNCYGVQEYIENIFQANEWEYAKKQGYYLA